MCWVSSNLKHAHQAFKGFTGDGTGGRQLCEASDVPSTRNGRSSERGTVRTLTMSWRSIGLIQGYRQCNMDYLLSSAIQGFRCHRLMISYDVGCQWFTNFWTRNQFLPPHLKINLPFDTIRALVPKFHLQSHEEKCHGPFSFNYHKGCGRTDGEGVERNWDELNPQGPSTSEMTPGHRWLTLDVCCGWVNFRKTMGLGKCAPAT